MKSPKLSIREAASVRLKDFCSFSSEKEEHFMEVTMWSNGEGYDVRITDNDGKKRFELTWGQYIALKKCVDAIDLALENG